MKVIEASETDLRIVDHPLGIAIAAALVGVLLLSASVARILAGGGWRAWLAPLLGAVVGLAAAAGFGTRRAFHFDRRARRVHWRRVGPLGAAGGSVPFDEVRSAFVEYREGGGAKAPRDFYRVTLATRAGLLPLSTAYAGGPVADERCQQVRSRVNAALGVSVGSESDNDILELMRSGQKLWAYKLAQRRQGFGAFGMKEAMAYVEGLARDGAGG